MRRVTASGVVPAQDLDDGSPANEAGPCDRRFKVLYGDVSTRKHKKWAGDGELHCRGRSVVLYDDDGNQLARTFTQRQLDELHDGSTLSFGGKEVLIDDIIDNVSATNRIVSKPRMSVSQPEVKPNFPRSNPAKRPALSPQAASTPPFKRPSGALPMVQSAKQFVVPIANYESSSGDASKEFVLNEAEVKAGAAKVVVPPQITRVLRPHQREGIQFLYDRLKMQDGGVVLADEMGLGKTLQTIAVTWALVNQGSRTQMQSRCLIVAPSSLLGNWIREFRKWIKNARIPVVLARNAKDLATYRGSYGQPFLLVSYETALRQADALAKIEFSLLVCDEAHRLKNVMSKGRIQLNSLDIRRRLLLTGTPLQNELDEFHSLLDFARPSYFGTSLEFRQLLQLEEDADEPLAQELNDKIVNTVLRRTTEVNHVNLPPKHDYILFCAPSAIQKVVYDKMTFDMFPGESLVLIDCLRKLANHPKLLMNSMEEAMRENKASKDLAVSLLSVFPKEYFHAPEAIADSGKLAVLLDLLTSFRLLEERAVIVSNYTKVMDMLESVCASVGAKVFRLDGSVPARQRQALVDQFNNSDPTDNVIFLLSTKAGGVGLNLMGASRLVLYDSDWNPANDLQAMARIWRDGQQRPCHIYRLCTTGTIDEKILQRQIRKTGITSVLDLEAVAKAVDNTVKFSDEEIQDIFSFNYTEETECETHSLMECSCAGDGTALEDRDELGTTTAEEDEENTKPEEDDSEENKEDDEEPKYEKDDEEEEDGLGGEETAAEKTASMAELFEWRHYSRRKDGIEIFKKVAGLTQAEFAEVTFAMQLDSNCGKTKVEDVDS